MVSAHLSTIGDVRRAGASKACLRASSSCFAPISDFQRGARPNGAPLAQTRFQIGAGGSSPRRAGAASLSSLRIGHPIVLSFARANGLCSNAFAHQPFVSIAAAVHLSLCLFKLSSSAGSIDASKRSQELGKVIHERGTIVQGGRCND